MRTFLASNGRLLRCCGLLPFLLGMLLHHNARTQGHPFYLYGEVWDLDTRILVHNAVVKAVDLEDSTKVFLGMVDKGRYDLQLPFDRSYRVEFTGPGYIRKHVLVDLHGVEEKKRKGDHGLNMEASLMRPVAGVDYALFAQRPYSVCRLNGKGRKFELDAAYTAEHAAAFKEVLDRHAEGMKLQGQ
jgi:hypothetical protein